MQANSGKDMDKREVLCIMCVCVCVYVCVEEYYLAIKREWDIAICNNMDEHGGHNAKEDKIELYLLTTENYQLNEW